MPSVAASTALETEVKSICPMTSSAAWKVSKLMGMVKDRESRLTALPLVSFPSRVKVTSCPAVQLVSGGMVTVSSGELV